MFLHLLAIQPLSWKSSDGSEIKTLACFTEGFTFQDVGGRTEEEYLVNKHKNHHAIIASF